MTSEPISVLFEKLGRAYYQSLKAKNADQFGSLDDEIIHLEILIDEVLKHGGANK